MEQIMATYKKEDFLRHADMVIPANFSRQGNEAYYVKQELGRELRMRFAEGIYYPHSVTMGGIMVNISIDSIESIFEEVFNAHPLPNWRSGSKRDTIGGGGYNIPGVDYDLLDNQDVEDDATFAIVRPHLELIVQGALQFYQDYSTLQAIHDHVETLSVMQMGTFLNQPMPARRMIVKRLVNAPDYESYAQSVVDLNITKPDPSRGIFYTALKTQLDSM